MKTDIRKLAYECLYEEFGGALSYFYPKDFKRLPAVSYYEVYSKASVWADDRQYLEEGEIMVDLWAKDSPCLWEMGIQADKAMEKSGFRKINTVEVFDDGLYHRAQRYRIGIGVE